MDYVEGLPKSETFCTILVVVDRFTKFAHFIAVKHPYTTHTIAHLMLDNIVKLHGLWYNSSFHTSLGCSLWRALYEYEPNLAAEPVTLDTNIQSVQDLITARQRHLSFLKAHLIAAQNRMKQHADKNRIELAFQVGDQVLLKLQPYAQSSLINRPFPKLDFYYFGPYSVLERVGSVAYGLKLPDDCTIHPVFHVSQLKPYTAGYTPVYTDLPTIPDLDKRTPYFRPLF
ncbi:hypothetical protein BS78_09G182100 [Paspalum vaginatum]|nr:hypothetical protein BS78_09G182100 [Paspalum vaginatum]